MESHAEWCGCGVVEEKAKVKKPPQRDECSFWVEDDADLGRLAPFRPSFGGDVAVISDHLPTKIGNFSSNRVKNRY